MAFSISFAPRLYANGTDIAVPMATLTSFGEQYRITPVPKT
jgi:hypothetical protein